MAKKVDPAPKKGAFSKAVGKFAKSWETAKKAKPGTFEDTDVPEGDYFVRVSSARAGVSKQGKGDPYVSVNFKIVRGPHTGGNLSRYAGIQTDKDLEFLSKDFQRMGYEVEDLALNEVEDLVADLAKSKPYLKVQVKKEEYVNRKGEDMVAQRVYIQKPVAANELPPGDDDDAPASKPKAKPKAPKKAAKK